MPLVVEDGSGKTSSANAYISTAFADVYFSARGNTLWTQLSTLEKEHAIVSATDYMAVYSSRWKGTRTSSTQALDWPRYGVVANGYDLASDVIPLPVANACAELAFRGAKGDLAPDLGAQKQSVTVGPISTTYAAGARQTTKFQAVDNMLAPYIGSAGMVRLVRA